ncbi:MAG: RNA polymerase sigma factor [Acidobacteria bacterium]|nr:RNA polymerase sigma factor [Acidobacteriota bacterium]
MITAIAGFGAVLPAAASIEGSEPLDRRTMDESAFEAFHRRTARLLWSRLYRLTGNAAKADDVSQKAYIQFIRTADATRSEPELRAYLYKLATRIAVDEWRSEERERAPRWLPFAATRSAHDDTVVRSGVEKALGGLSVRDRAILWMAYVDGANHQEIAAAVGVGPASVKVILFRARKRMAEALSSLGIGPEVLG